MGFPAPIYFSSVRGSISIDEPHPCAMSLWSGIKKKPPHMAFFCAAAVFYCRAAVRYLSPDGERRPARRVEGGVAASTLFF